MSTNQKEKLFSEFSPVTKTEWEELIQRELDSTEFRDKLIWHTREGFSISPFFTVEDFTDPPPVIPSIYTRNWKCCELIVEGSPEQANQAIKQASEGGVEACLLQSRITTGSDQSKFIISGVSILTQADMDKLTDGIAPAMELIFDFGMALPLKIELLRKLEEKAIQYTAVYDPLTEAAKTGYISIDESDIKNTIERLTEYRSKNLLCADGAFYHNAGATIIQEAGITLAIASEYLAIADNHTKQNIADMMFIRFATGPLFFPEIAKYRAIRLLWPKLLQAFGIENSKPLRIFAETGKTNKTNLDSYNNLLRSVTEATSAATGGADILMVHPFQNNTGAPESFSLRISRNIQHILREEAHFNKTDDPSSGSYYIEMLTDTVARESWEYFRKIESKGGFLKSLKSGFIRDDISDAREKKERDYAEGHRIMIGTNRFPNPGEKISAKVNNTYSENEISFPEGGFDSLAAKFYSHDKHSALAIKDFRAAKPFEQIRLRTDKWAGQSNRIPLVRLMTIGNAKWSEARATFSQNVFGCAGFEVITTGGDLAALDTTNRNNSDADIFVLCSSDEEYERYSEQFCRLLSGKGILILAGKPSEKEDLFRKMGINEFIFSGMNLPHFLQNIQDSLFEKRRDGQA